MIKYYDMSWITERIKDAARNDIDDIIKTISSLSRDIAGKDPIDLKELIKSSQQDKEK